jgi:hypothetical protein
MSTDIGKQYLGCACPLPSLNAPITIDEPSNKENLFYRRGRPQRSRSSNNSGVSAYLCLPIKKTYSAPLGGSPVTAPHLGYHHCLPSHSPTFLPSLPMQDRIECGRWWWRSSVGPRVGRGGRAHAYTRGDGDERAPTLRHRLKYHHSKLKKIRFLVLN